MIVFITSWRYTFHCAATSNYYSNFDRLSSYGAANHGSNDQNLNIHQDLSSFGSYSPFGSSGNFHINLDQGFKDSNVEHTIAQIVPISKHVEVTKPVPVPVVKNIGEILQIIAIN